MDKPKKSGPAIFMYCVIAVTLLTALVCFTLYYSGFSQNGAILWTGVAAFTVMYHLWMRLIMGYITRYLPIRYTQGWFQERRFEKKLYQLLRVKQWKGKALTYDPEAFSLQKHSLEEVANAMSKAETDHWINLLISLSTLLFAIPWGALGLFLVSALAAMAFDAQFILIQRYNRPRVLRVLKKARKRKEIS